MSASGIEVWNVTTPFDPVTSAHAPEGGGLEAIATAGIAIGALGLLCNGVVLLVLLTFTDLRKRCTILYILNQTVVDLLTGTFLILIHAIPGATDVRQTVAGLVYCHLWISQFPLWTCLNLSTFNLLALTLDRYFSVVYPIRHKLLCTRPKVLASIGLMWILTAPYQLAMSSPGIKIINNQCSVFAWSSPKTQQAKGIFGTFVEYVIPLFLLVFCYTRMFCALRVKVAPMATGAASQLSTVRARGKRKIIKMMMIVATAYIMCMSWNQVWYLLYNLQLLANDSYRSKFYHFSVIAMFSNCFVNPFIYAAKYEEFQKGLKKIFRYKSGSEQPGDTIDTSQ